MAYTHHIPGRFRVRSAAVKGNAVRASALEHWLETLEGVECAHVNPLTGSILVHYTVGVADASALISLMRERKWIMASEGIRPNYPKPARALAPAPKLRVKAGPPADAVERAIAKAVLKYLAEFAIERSVVALVAAVL